VQRLVIDAEHFIRRLGEQGCSGTAQRPYSTPPATSQPSLSTGRDPADLREPAPPLSAPAKLSRASQNSGSFRPAVRIRSAHSWLSL
jgi:hypothetical protein